MIMFYTIRPMSDDFRSFTEQVQKIIAQKGTLESDIYDRKLNREREALEGRVRESKSELKDIETKYRLLKREGLKELPDIGLEKEWVQFYRAWDSFLSERKGRRAAELDLVNFHAEIAEKLTKQTSRLKRLQEYSIRLKERAASKHAAKSSHRIRRIQKVKDILVKFEANMDVERRRNYDKRLADENQLSQELSSQLEECHRQKMEIETNRKTVLESNKKREDEIVKFEEEVIAKSARTKQSLGSLKKTNEELKRMINLANARYSKRSEELKDLDSLLESSKMLFNSIQRSSTVAEEIHA